MNKLNKELFKVQAIKPEEQEIIVEESVSFFKDAFRNLRRNKIAMTSLFIILIIIIMSIISPNFNDFRYDRDVAYKQDYTLNQSSKLPPRIPVIEKLGIFNGVVTREIAVTTIENDDNIEGTYEVKSEPYERRGILVQKAKENTYIKNDMEDYFFWFGTDNLGRDLWTRVWIGVRISLFIGFFAAIVDIVLGVTYGLISGFFGGKVDLIMMRIIEIISQIPALVILILLILVMDPGLLTIAIAISMTSWTGVARVVRSQVLKLKNQEFVLASKTLGASSGRIIFKHLFPNIVGQIIVMATFSIPSAIFYEAFLSLIGLGLPAPLASMGSLINEGRAHINSYPYMILIPSVILSVLMLSINMLANGLRDAFDPKMRER